MKKDLNLEMLQKFVNLYGINSKLDKVCLYMVHYYISQRRTSSFPSKILPLINKIIFNVDDLQKRMFEDILMDETRKFIGKTGVILYVEREVYKKLLFEKSNNFSLNFRMNLWGLQFERGTYPYFHVFEIFRRFFLEYSSVNENIPLLMEILHKRIILHKFFYDKYFFFIEEMVCELIDLYHHDENFSCRTTHKGYLTEEIFEYPEAITALLNFMLELQASKMLCTQQKRADAVKERLIELGWKFPEKNL